MRAGWPRLLNWSTRSGSGAKANRRDAEESRRKQNMTAEQRMQRPLSEVDPEIYEAIRHEVERQDGQLELIASENFTSEAVLEATGSVFTNKYAEGYPGKRYYGGCEFTDIVENLARERGKKLF